MGDADDAVAIGRAAGAVPGPAREIGCMGDQMTGPGEPLGKTMIDETDAHVRSGGFDARCKRRLFARIAETGDRRILRVAHEPGEEAVARHMAPHRRPTGLQKGIGGGGHGPAGKGAAGFGAVM